MVTRFVVEYIPSTWYRRRKAGLVPVPYNLAALDKLAALLRLATGRPL
jgi:hypothetical protein